MGTGTEVAELIRATDHFQGPSIHHKLKDVMLSVDLAILGQNDEVYEAYTRAIRQEYAHVDEARFREQRRLALIHLRGKAESGEMFGDPYFAGQYNDKAIDNLTREIDALGE